MSMPDQDPNRGFGAFHPAHLVLPAIFAVVAAFLFVRDSMVQGKLLAPPMPDDINYMSDAALRLNEFYAGGMWALVQGYIDNPPHSPFSTFLALISFALFGMHEWAPYAANTVVAFLYFGIAAYILRELPIWKRTAIMVMLACLPVAAASIREFRPDIAAALLIVLGLVIAVEKPLLRCSWRRQALVGVIFGAAILTKPSTFPITGALFALTVLAAGVFDPAERSLHRRGTRTIRAGLIAAAAAGLVALPHFLLAARRTIAYIENNIFGGDRELWAVEGSTLFHLRYYIDGPAGTFMLGHYAWPVMVMALVAGACSLRWDDHAARRRGLVMAVVCIAAYTLATVNHVKQEYFGLAFQLTVVYAAVMGLRLMVLHGRKSIVRHVSWPSAVLVLLAAGAVLGFRFWLTWAPTTRPPIGMHVLRELHEDVYQTALLHAGARPEHIFVTFNGRIHFRNLQFRAAQDRAPMRFHAVTRARTPDLYEPEYERAFLVIAADPNHPHIWQRIQGAEFHAEVLETLRSKPEFVHVKELTLPRHAFSIHVFKRRPQ